MSTIVYAPANALCTCICCSVALVGGALFSLAQESSIHSMLFFLEFGFVLKFYCAIVIISYDICIDYIYLKIARHKINK